VWEGGGGNNSTDKRYCTAELFKKSYFFVTLRLVKNSLAISDTENK
jgi:hypothetical protein